MGNYRELMYFRDFENSKRKEFMLFTKKDQLTILRLNNNEERIFIGKLEEVLTENPSNVIYCEINGKLDGIISTGDIRRGLQMGQEWININRKFLSIHPGEYMKAKTMFKTYESINALPVVTENGILAGEYIRWDDLSELRYRIFDQQCERDIFKEKSNVVLVRPGNIFVDRWIVFQLFCEYLELQKIQVIYIDHFEVGDYLETADIILFVDENEIRACRIRLMIRLYEKYSRGGYKLKTYKDILEKSIRSTNEQAVLYLKRLLDKEIKIIGLVYRDSEYGKNLDDRIHNRFASVGKTVSGILPDIMYKEFFDDLYDEEYVEEILHIPYVCVNNGGVLSLKDYHSQYYNVINGERVTTNQPERYVRSVYFFGPCYIMGRYVEDRNTIESFLQRKLCSDGEEIRVVNCGCLGYQENNKWLPRIACTTLRKGDVVVISKPPLNVEGIDYLDLMEILECSKVKVEWLVDNLVHCNHKVNKIYAEAIYNELKPILSKSEKELGKTIEKDEDYISFLYLKRYFAKFDHTLYENVGSIVMNCNPFTKGYRYLIEQALNSVDFLIIFIVEEDKSVFSFAERFAMVKQGTMDLHNLMVVPSGPFILSQMSFPEYFVKETGRDMKAHTEQDIILFAKKIAPPLGIKCRFVGEEPEDAVTNQYNETMKKILPEYNIEVIEIPRKKMLGTNISASLVRDSLNEFDNDKVVGLLQETTCFFLGI